MWNGLQTIWSIYLLFFFYNGLFFGKHIHTHTQLFYRYIGARCSCTLRFIYIVHCADWVDQDTTARAIKFRSKSKCTCVHAGGSNIKLSATYGHHWSLCCYINTVYMFCIRINLCNFALSHSKSMKSILFFLFLSHCRSCIHHITRRNVIYW